MRKLLSRDRINIVFSFFLLSVIIYLVFIFLNINNSEKQSKINEQSINKLNVLQDILFDVKNLESNQRGYLLTKQEELLKNYSDNIKDLNQKMIQVHKIFDSSALKAIAYDSIELMIKKRIAFADSTIELYKNISRDSAVKVVIGARGIYMMDFIQTKIEHASNYYLAEVRKFNDYNKIQIKYRFYYFNLIVFFFIIVITFNFYLIKRDEKIQKEKYLISKQFLADLESQINQKTKELNLANEELKISNDRYLFIAEASNQAHWDWDMKTNEIWGNELYLNVLGKKENDSNNYKDFISRIHPDEFNHVNESFDVCVKERGRKISFEFRFEDNKGGWRYLVNRAIVLYDPNGIPYRTLGTFEDVTEAKLAALEIQKQKDISDTLIESLPGVFFMFDSNGKFIRWNNNLTKITGYLPEDMEDLNPFSFLSEEQVGLVASKITSVFENGIDYVEADLLTKDKKRIPYFYTGVRVRINDEDCLMGVGIDVSERVNYQQQLKALTLYLQQIREEERTSISREIHDELGQQLTGLKMNLSMLKRKVSNDGNFLQSVNDAISITNEAMGAVRRISAQLRPSILDDLGLLSAMEWQSEEFEKKYGITTVFISNQSNIENISTDIQTGIFRIYQESLTNVLKHAQATKVEVSLHIDNKIITMVITDNGVGFDAAEIEKKRTFGMLGIRERAVLLKGSCLFSGKPGLGTTVLVKIPISV